MKTKAFKKSTALLLAFVMLLTPLINASALSLPYTPSSYYAASVYYTRVRNVSLTGCPRIDLINVAHSQLGYHEGNSVSQLGGGNTSGENNYTEYGYWYGTQIMGNSSGHYGPWCAMFVSWCAAVANIPSSVINCACYAHVGSNSFYFHMPFHYRGTYTPIPGDLVFFDWPDDDTQWNHVAIVYAVTGGNVYTLEGNTIAECVEKRGFPLNDSKILGYGVPNYSNNTVPGYVPSDLPALWDENDPNNYPVPDTTLSMGDTGQEVRWLQAALKRLGYPLTIDGYFGTGTYNAVRAFQTAQGLNVTGTCNTATRNRIKALLAALPTPTPTPTPTPVVTPSPTPTATPSPTPTATPSSTPTAVPDLPTASPTSLTSESPMPTPISSPTPTPTPAPGPDDPGYYPVPTRELSYGCTGDDVRWLQAALNVIQNAELDVDGSYGPLTYNAVKVFQSAHGLEPDGVCGFATRDAIIACLEALAEPSPTPTPEPTPSPTPEPTPSPTPEPTPSPTPEPTPEHTPTPEPTPSPTPEFSPTPGPTPDTSPTAEPSPGPTDLYTPVPSPSAFVPGDVDGDGVVTAGDALTILRYSMGLAELINEQAADYDGNGTVTAADALMALRAALGISVK